MLHNGKGDRAHREPCNGDYQHGKKEVTAVQGGAYYLAGRQCGSGGNMVYQVTKLRKWAAAYMSAALLHITERRCLLWQLIKEGASFQEGYNNDTMDMKLDL